MAIAKPVAWVEGMLVCPEHFQQQDRSIIGQLNLQREFLHHYGWGWSLLEIDNTLLKCHKLKLSACAGIFPDGCLFQADQSMLESLVLSIENTEKSGIIYLAVAIKEWVSDGMDKSCRFSLEEKRVTNVVGQEHDNKALLVKKLQLHLLNDKDDEDLYITLPVAKIKRVNDEEGIVLDHTFIPSSLSLRANFNLQKNLEEIYALIERKQKQLAASLVAPLQSQVLSSLTDIILLQCLNRYTSNFYQIIGSANDHPYNVYQLLISLLAELSTHYCSDRSPANYPLYNHENLSICFDKLKIMLFELLSINFHHQVSEVELTKQDEGHYEATISNKNLLVDCQWIFSISAAMPINELQDKAEKCIKISAPDDIKNIVHLQLTGLPLHRLSVIPPQIPYQADRIYFQIDKTNPKWSKIVEHQTIVVFFSQVIPNLKIKLWAIPEHLMEQKDDERE